MSQDGAHCWDMYGYVYREVRQDVYLVCFFVN